MVDADEYQIPFPGLPVEINVYILLHLDLQTLVRIASVYHY